MLEKKRLKENTSHLKKRLLKESFLPLGRERE
jgi:hypothetical protein